MRTLCLSEDVGGAFSLHLFERLVSVAIVLVERHRPRPIVHRAHRGPFLPTGRPNRRASYDGLADLRYDQHPHLRSCHSSRHVSKKLRADRCPARSGTLVGSVCQQANQPNDTGAIPLRISAGPSGRDRALADMACAAAARGRPSPCRELFGLSLVGQAGLVRASGSHHAGSIYRPRNMRVRRWCVVR
ncbi:MAG: hypothetical protein JWM36_7 [Hyphomicrobiales bacterium]|nr:hypothetical protein [Hyphomicrobiales bacterium]